MPQIRIIPIDHYARRSDGDFHMNWVREVYECADKESHLQHIYFEDLVATPFFRN